MEIKELSAEQVCLFASSSLIFQSTNLTCCENGIASPSPV